MVLNLALLMQLILKALKQSSAYILLFMYYIRFNTFIVYQNLKYIFFFYYFAFVKKLKINF